ncbi:MAG: hypothetical protein ACE5KJ_04880 [Candidatus Zixiibacteriota bacterium]
MMSTRRKILFLSILFIFMSNCSKYDVSPRHPWASFASGSWVNVHTYHRMIMKGEEPSIWESDSRIVVMKVEEDRVTLRHHLPSLKIQEEAILPVPAVDVFPGTRALGQWPHDIFPYGPERQEGVASEDKNPFPQQVTLKVLKETTDIFFQGKKYPTKLYLKEWDVSTKTGKRHYVMKAWVTEGIELPLKWIITSSDGSDDSETELVNLEDVVKVGKNQLTCMVTVTKKKLPEGVIVKKRWSSTQVPGFMVKMESWLEGQGFSLEVKEWITGFFVK